MRSQALRSESSWIGTAIQGAVLALAAKALVTAIAQELEARKKQPAPREELVPDPKQT
jgi:hypothetical protein